MILNTDDRGFLLPSTEILSICLRACILIDLCRRGRIQPSQAISNRILCSIQIKVVDQSRTGEPLLDEALSYLSQSGRTIHDWLESFNRQSAVFPSSRFRLKEVRQRCKKLLVEKGLFYMKKGTFLSFEYTNLILVDMERREKLRQNVRLVLASKKFNKTVGDKELCLGVFCELLGGFLGWKEKELCIQLVNSLFFGNIAELYNAWNFENDMIVGIMHCICRKRVELVMK